MTARTWLVTGAAGFIGSNLAQFLMDRGEAVVGLDNFFSGRRSNLDRLAGRFGDQFRFVEADILDHRALTQAIAGCDVVAHLAAQVSVMRSIDDPEETHAINTTGFMQVVRAAGAAGARNLIYASSCAVYGDNDALPLAETEVPRPMSPYAASKLANEVYARGLQVLAPETTMVGLRFFNIFGSWQDAASSYAAVIPRWIKLLLDGGRPVIFGDGGATRDFCHVENVCEAIWVASRAAPATAGGVFNVATGVATRLDSLYALLARLFAEAGRGPAVEPEHMPWRAGEVLHSYADTRAAAAVLGFEPAVDLEEGLRRMLTEGYGLQFSTANKRS